MLPSTLRALAKLFACVWGSLEGARERALGRVGEVDELGGLLAARGDAQEAAHAHVLAGVLLQHLQLQHLGRALHDRRSCCCEVGRRADVGGRLHQVPIC